MSANTYVTKRLWRIARQVLAGFAGAVVSTTGLTSAALAAQQLAGFEFLPGLGPIDLVAAPAGAGALADHTSVRGAASLADPALKDGLQPGESAFFGYDLGLARDASRTVWVQMNPVAEGAEGSQLSYEVRSVTDATQCRTLWAGAQTVVPARAFSASASDAFPLPATDHGVAHLHLCIRVTLDASATSTQTGSVTWGFTASEK